MPIYSFDNIKPQIDSTCYIADGAQVIGKVTMLEHASVWHNSVIRGDVNRISIGKCTNVQDLSMLHVTERSPLVLEDNVTIGHSVTLHGCHVENNCLIGMGAVLLDDCRIGEFSIVAAGSVVPPKKNYPARSLILGAPGKVVRSITDDEYKMLCNHFLSYVKYKDEFLNLVKRLD